MNRYPYHRYLTYLVLEGEEDIPGHLSALEYIPPLDEDVDELRTRLNRPVNRGLRKKYDVLFFDDENMDVVYWLVETVPARTCAERLLLDRVHPKHVATVLSLKFNEKVTEATVDRFRRGFWDTSVLTPTDFTAYFRMGGERKPDPPPGSLETRAHYSAWKEGLLPDEEALSPDSMIREVQVDAFMVYKRHLNQHDHKTAIDFARLLLKTAGTRAGLTRKTGSGVPPIKPILEYGDNHVPTLGELHSEYSEEQSGTGAVSEAMGRREDDDDLPA